MRLGPLGGVQVRRGGADPVRALRRGGGGRRHGALEPRLEGWRVQVREVCGDVRGAREVQAHGDLLVARRDGAWARFTRSAGLEGVRIWVLARKRDEERGGRQTGMGGHGSCLDLEKGRLREDRRREGMLGVSQGVWASGKEEDEDIMLHGRDVDEHEIP